MKKAADTPAPGLSEVLRDGHGAGAEGGSDGDAESRAGSRSHSEPQEGPGWVGKDAKTAQRGSRRLWRRCRDLD